MSDLAFALIVLFFGVIIGYLAGRATATDAIRAEAVDYGYACYIAPKHGGVAEFKWECKP